MSLGKSLAKVVAVTASLGACTSVPQNPYFTQEGRAFRDRVAHLSCLRGITDTRASIDQVGLNLKVKKVGSLDRNPSLADIQAADAISQNLVQQLEALYGKDYPEVMACRNRLPKRD